LLALTSEVSALTRYMLATSTAGCGLVIIGLQVYLITQGQKLYRKCFR
jgi:hypothetical protein